jgi:hypothetical protein
MLRRKYAWVREAVAADRPRHQLNVRPCMASDLDAVAALFEAATGEPVSREGLLRFVPDLAQDWRVALVAMGPDDQPVAFAALGPVIREAHATSVDCYAIIHPDYRTEDVTAALAAEVNRRYERFTVQYPLGRGEPPYRLKPCTLDWCALAPGVAGLLGIDEGTAETVAEGAQAE